MKVRAIYWNGTKTRNFKILSRTSNLRQKQTKTQFFVSRIVLTSFWISCNNSRVICCFAVFQNLQSCDFLFVYFLSEKLGIFIFLVLIFCVCIMALLMEFFGWSQNNEKLRIIWKEEFTSQPKNSAAIIQFQKWWNFETTN